jgi:hypothetical protein
MRNNMAVALYKRCLQRVDLGGNPLRNWSILAERKPLWA